MSIYESNGENILIHTEAYYEEIASQEEVYLEEREEELRAILTSDAPLSIAKQRLCIDRESRRKI